MISTRCRCPSERCRTSVRGEIVQTELAEHRLHPSFGRIEIENETGVGAEDDVFNDREIWHQCEMLIDGPDPLTQASAGERIVVTRPLTSIVPASG